MVLVLVLGQKVLEKIKYFSSSFQVLSCKFDSMALTCITPGSAGMAGLIHNGAVLMHCPLSRVWPGEANCCINTGRDNTINR